MHTINNTGAVASGSDTQPRMLLAGYRPPRCQEILSILEAVGLEVVGKAVTATEMLVLARTLKPELVVLDTVLKPESGYAVEACRDLKGLPEAPLVVLFGDKFEGTPEDPEGAERLHFALSGADGCVDSSRPDAMEKLVEATGRVLAGVRVRFEA